MLIVFLRFIKMWCLNSRVVVSLDQFSPRSSRICLLVTEDVLHLFFPYCYVKVAFYCQYTTNLFLVFLLFSALFLNTLLLFFYQDHLMWACIFKKNV